MPIPSTLYPVQEVVEISEKRNLDTMPTPELQTQMTISRSENGIFHINGQMNEQTLEWLRTCAAQVEAQLKQKSIESTPVISPTTTVSQATDDCEAFPTKPDPNISDIFPTVETVNTSVEVHSPDEVHKPWFGNISEGQSDVLAKLLQSSGIHEEKVTVKIDRTAKWATDQQVTLGITGDLEGEEKTLETEQEYNNLVQFAKPEQLPDIPALNNSDSFELEDTEVDKLLDRDPYLGDVFKVKQELENATTSCIDLGKLHPHLAEEQDDGMGQYRNPPSVSSIISNSTYVSEYSNLRSPGNEFEALDESNVSMPQKVTGRRSTKRRTSGGKDLKRLMSGAKTPKSILGKPYPPASARNGRLSRLQHGEYHENNLQEGWWNMLKNVERLFRANLDFPSAKVEDLRKYDHDLFAVVLFSPTEWGNNQKRKGIYREILKEQYNWDPTVPFRSINNSPKKGDAPRANKDDLVKIGLYLMRRYRDEVRHLVKLKNERNQLVPLDGVEKNAVTGFDAVTTTVPAPPFANTVHNHLAIASEVPKMEQLSLTPAVVEPAMMNALDFPAPVNQATVATPAETVTNGYIAMETGEPSSTVDLEMLLQCLGDNNHLVTTGNQTFDSLNIEPRQPEQQMDMADDELTYKNPEMKALKREHSYSLPEEEKETEELSKPVMTVSHDYQIPGTVLHLAETKQSGMIKTVNNVDYMVEKFSEMCPTKFSQVMEMIEALKHDGGAERPISA